MDKTLEQLQAEFNEARKGKTLEERERAKALWAAMVAISPPVRKRGFGSRAGQRQAKERRAMEAYRRRP